MQSQILERILKLKEVCERTALSRSTVYLWIAEGRFPAAINLGNRSVGWLESEVSEWINERINSSRK